MKWEYLAVLLSMVFLSEFPKWEHYAGTNVGKVHYYTLVSLSTEEEVFGN